MAAGAGVMEPHEISRLQALINAVEDELTPYQIRDLLLFIDKEVTREVQQSYIHAGNLAMCATGDQSLRDSIYSGWQERMCCRTSTRGNP